MKGVQPKHDQAMWAFFSFLADKDACLARATELKALADAANEAERTIAPRETAVTDRETKADIRDADLAKREAQVTIDHNDLVARATAHADKVAADGAALAGQQRALEQLRAEIATEQKALDDRTAKVEADETAAAAARADAEKMRDDLAARLAKIREAAGNGVV